MLLFAAAAGCRFCCCCFATCCGLVLLPLLLLLLTTPLLLAACCCCCGLWKHLNRLDDFAGSDHTVFAKRKKSIESSIRCFDDASKELTPNAKVYEQSILSRVDQLGYRSMIEELKAIWKPVQRFEKKNRTECVRTAKTTRKTRTRSKGSNLNSSLLGDTFFYFVLS